MKELTNIFSKLSLMAFITLLCGCDMFGYDFQKNTKYDDSRPTQFLNMTALEFMKSRPDVFSSMLEAIAHAGIEAEYTVPGRTYLLLTDRALSDDTYLPTAQSAAGSYFACNKVKNPEEGAEPEYITPISWDIYPKAQVKEFLEYHILMQEITITESMDYKIFFKTLAYKNKGDRFFVSTEWVRDRLCKFSFNSFTGHRILALSPVVSNIRCKSGAIHIFNDYLEPPTKAVLDTYKVEY